MTDSGWTRLDCALDGGPAARAAIGLVVLANDTVIEPEVRRFLPMSGVEVYSSRIPMARDVSPESLAAMAEALPRAVELLLPDDRLDVVAFGCTSGSMIIGPERIAGIIETVRPGVKVCDPVSASLTAFAALGVRRIGLVTPYRAEVNARVERFFSGNGLDIAARASFDQQSDVSIARIREDDILRAAVEIGRQDVEAVFLSCTALRCFGIIDAVEAATGKPVVTSNQALAWHALRKAGVMQTVPGAGRLWMQQEKQS
ncbi:MULTISPECIES: aspartate/glutamate racemase family protein [unclassified Rhizobium]|uniref:maleate cis-trans isomerase family protein n=1 Tax=unclassified Rhizobium TaxID=2613769 RepID=UPI0006FDFF0C|nr:MULTISPECIES: aspartate/glutamate racemase family protein [unclassified Rhizobium]KQV33557.1 Asp/Glu racemase [Rhizobium sp. Root1212]KRD23101.1 Asp/Glu racemase [Rhizobium sp. Root268]